ncbi:sulfite exporter TauE/SafE family protein [Oceanithermus sp.]
MALGLNLLAVFAFAVKGLAGFGPALFLVPALSLFWPLRQVVPYTAFLLFLANLPMLWLVRRELEPRRDLPAAAAYALGLVLGTRLLLALPEARLKFALGVVLLVFSLWGLVWLPAPAAAPPLDAAELARLLAVMVSGGIIVGTLGAGALPLFVYLPLRYPPAAMRALFTSAFGLGTLAWTLANWQAGLLTGELVRLALLSLPGTLAGLWLGARLFERLPQRGQMRAVALLLVPVALRLMGVF